MNKISSDQISYKFDYSNHGEKSCPKCSKKMNDIETLCKLTDQSTKIFYCKLCNERIQFKCKYCAEKNEKRIYFNIRDIPKHLRKEHNIDIPKRKSPSKIEKKKVMRHNNLRLKKKIVDSIILTNDNEITENRKLCGLFLCFMNKIKPENKFFKKLLEIIERHNTIIKCKHLKSLSNIDTKDIKDLDEETLKQRIIDSSKNLISIDYYHYIKLYTMIVDIFLPQPVQSVQPKQTVQTVQPMQTIPFTLPFPQIFNIPSFFQNDLPKKINTPKMSKFVVPGPPSMVNKLIETKILKVK